MKNIVLKLLMSLVLFSPLVCSAQDLSIELTGNEGNRVKKLLDKFSSKLISETKAIRFIYVDTEVNRNSYYFGLITDKDQIVINPPSYYFFNSNNEPVAVYTGIEKNISFSQAYLNEIRELTDKFLLSREIIMTVHYYVWFIEFKNGKEVKFTDRLSKKKQQKIPSWILSKNKP